MLHTRKPQTQDAQAAMAERNAKRLAITKRAMGEKYAHHPAHHVQRSSTAPREMAFNPQLLHYGMIDGFVIRGNDVLIIA